MARMGISPTILLTLCVLSPVAASRFVVTVNDAAVKNEPVPGARCTLYNEANAVVGTTIADSRGVCTITPSPVSSVHVYSLFVSKAAYYPVQQSRLEMRDTEKNMNVQLSKKLDDQNLEYRVVLSWGNNHQDMDSHLYVPAETPGGSHTDVHYNYRNFYGAGPIASRSTAKLDVDDTDGYGPETITLKNPHAGVYSYFAHIYDPGNTVCFDSAGIQARVEVWGSKQGGLIKALKVPKENPPSKCGLARSNTCHRNWHVFNLDTTTNTFHWVNKIVGEPGLDRSGGMDRFRAFQAAMDPGAAYLPKSSSSCTCSTLSEAVTTSDDSWTQWAHGAASYIDTKLFGESTGLARGLCREHLTQSFSQHLQPVSQQAAAVATRLATKIKARFDHRKTLSQNLRNRMLSGIAGHHTLPTEARGPQCEMSCLSCRFDAAFHSAVNKNDFMIRYGARADADIARSQGKLMTDLGEKIVEHLGEDATTKWTFVGTEKGGMVMAPQYDFGRSRCRSYDPRLRPWYAEGVAGAKNVVIIVNGATSVATEELLTLKQGAKAVLGTLAAGDTATVIVARTKSTGPQYNVIGDAASTDKTYRDCHDGQMLRTTLVNKALLHRYIDEIQRDGPGVTDLAPAMDKAKSLLQHQRSFAQTNYPSINSTDIVVVFDRASARSHAGLKAVKDSYTASGKGPFWFLYELGSDPMATGTGGVFDRHEQLTVADAGFAPARYYTLPALRKTTNADTFASAVYADSSGLGLISTMVSPVYDSNNAFVGAAGVDVTILELVSDIVFDREFSSSYAFIVDATGSALWHPALPSPGDAQSVEPVNIKNLEVSPSFASDVYDKLVQGQTGTADVTVDMPIARGDATFAGFATTQRSVTFAFRPIEGTPFRLCVALTAEDKASRILDHNAVKSQFCRNPTANDVCDIYHYLPLGQTCSHIARVQSPQNVPIIKRQSSIFYASTAFDNPAAWLEQVETTSIANTLGQRAVSFALCPDRYYDIALNKAVGQLKREAQADNIVARSVDSCWRQRQDENSTELGLIWTYFGTPSGVFRSMPAHKSRKKYDPTKRPWYLSAVANRAADGSYGPIITLPYLDASGTGQVITVAQAIKRGSSANDPVAGVVGVDFKLSTIQDIVDQNSYCKNGGTCMLLDSTAHIAYHPDFTAPSARDENVFVASKHREVANKLVADGVLVQNSCMDYGEGTRKTSYKIELPPGGAKGALTCGRYALVQAGKSNMYLLAITSNGCMASQNAVTCTPCTAQNCAAATWASLKSTKTMLCQPCRCKTEYDSCSLSYGSQSYPACPASPPPLFDDLCPAGTPIGVTSTPTFTTTTTTAAPSGDFVSGTVRIVTGLGGITKEELTKPGVLAAFKAEFVRHINGDFVRRLGVEARRLAQYKVTADMIDIHHFRDPELEDAEDMLGSVQFEIDIHWTAPEANRDQIPYMADTWVKKLTQDPLFVADYKSAMKSALKSAGANINDSLWDNFDIVRYTEVVHHEEDNAGEIAGIVIGILIFFCLLGFIAKKCCCAQKAKTTTPQPATMQVQPRPVQVVQQGAGQQNPHVGVVVAMQQPPSYTGAPQQAAFVHQPHVGAVVATQPGLVAPSAPSAPVVQAVVARDTKEVSF